MSSHPLKNYLRTYRLRSGLTQKQIGALLGCKDGSKVSRYESLLREPELKTALAYQAITGVPVHELFAGVYKEVEARIEKRKRLLLKKFKQTERGEIEIQIDRNCDE